MATDDDFPVDDLPLPKPGKSRGTMTVTERVAQGGVAPPPQVVVDLRQEQSAAGVAVEGGTTPPRAASRTVRRRRLLGVVIGDVVPGWMVCLVEPSERDCGC